MPDRRCGTCRYLVDRGCVWRPAPAPFWLLSRNVMPHEGVDCPAWEKKEEDNV